MGKGFRPLRLKLPLAITTLPLYVPVLPWPNWESPFLSKKKMRRQYEQKGIVEGYNPLFHGAFFTFSFVVFW